MIFIFLSKHIFATWYDHRCHVAVRSPRPLAGESDAQVPAGSFRPKRLGTWQTRRLGLNRKPWYLAALLCGCQAFILNGPLIGLKFRTSQVIRAMSNPSAYSEVGACWVMDDKSWKLAKATPAFDGLRPTSPLLWFLISSRMGMFGSERALYQAQATNLVASGLLPLKVYSYSSWLIYFKPKPSHFLWQPCFGTRSISTIYNLCWEKKKMYSSSMIVRLIQQGRLCGVTILGYHLLHSIYPDTFALCSGSIAFTYAEDSTCRGKEERAEFLAPWARGKIITMNTSCNLDMKSYTAGDIALKVIVNALQTSSRHPSSTIEHTPTHDDKRSQPH